MVGNPVVVIFSLIVAAWLVGQYCETYKPYAATILGIGLIAIVLEFLLRVLL